MLTDVPSWALYMRNWELISTVAYTLAFALIESLIVITPFILLGLILPKKWVREGFIPWAGAMLVEGAIAAIAFQEVLRTSGPKKITVALILLALGLSSILVVWSGKLRKFIRIVGQRFSVLTFLYVFIDLIGLVIVVARNV